MTAADWLSLWAVAAAFGLASAVLSCMPGTHVSCLLAALLVFTEGSSPFGNHPGWLIAACAGAVAGHAMAGFIPALLLAAPDDTTLPTVAMAGNCLSRETGMRAAALTFLGGLCSATVVASLSIPAAGAIGLVHAVMKPHLSWVVWSIIVLILMSGSPPQDAFGVSIARRIARGYVPTLVGWLAFVSSGLLGLVLLYRSPFQVTATRIGLAPAFAGLFSVPCLLLSALLRVRVPDQRLYLGPAPSVRSTAVGAAVGCAGGLLPALFPAIGGGAGNLMAAKALARSGAETFLISQGAARFIFHVAGLVLWLLPGIGASGGSAANLLQAQYEMRPTRDYAVAIAAIPAAAAAAAVAGLALCRGLAALLHRLGRDRVSTAALLAMAAGTLALYGWAGIGVLAVASAIGVLAALLGARRENCFAVVLLPMACELSGIGPDVALWLGME